MIQWEKKFGSVRLPLQVVCMACPEDAAAEVLMIRSRSDTPSRQTLQALSKSFATEKMEPFKLQVNQTSTLDFT
jgi:hypothetical protein